MCPKPLQPPIYMAVLPVWTSGIKEPRRFSAGKLFLLTSGIISLSPRFKAKEGEGICPVSLSLGLGSLLFKPGFYPFFWFTLEILTYLLSAPDSLWILTTGVNQPPGQEGVGDLRVGFHFFLRKMGAQGGAEDEITQPSAPRALKLPTSGFPQDD